ncbi:hypothetical protein T484DRAFT_2501435 [Baffinella frigidus]|nr:hypothetical protein T484DRAFT_2501435 [Cryptophyta sp. CCMP2293]
MRMGLGVRGGTGDARRLPPSVRAPAHTPTRDPRGGRRQVSRGTPPLPIRTPTWPHRGRFRPICTRVLSPWSGVDTRSGHNFSVQIGRLTRTR